MYNSMMEPKEKKKESVAQCIRAGKVKWENCKKQDIRLTAPKTFEKNAVLPENFRL